MSAAFITATGTDIGKTFVARGLIRHVRQHGRTVDALKPVLSGYDEREADGSDPGLLLAALGRDVTLDSIARMSPWRFAAPLSPHIAARREQRAIDFAELVAFSRDAIGRAPDSLFIEGAGGVMVPIDDAHTMLDWMAELRLPLVLVAGSYLGTISHTLTALEVIERRGLKVAAVVVSETPGSSVPLDENTDSIAEFARAPVIALPRLPLGTLDHPAFARIAATIA
jgi:dethiobiotin synthetase